MVSASAGGSRRHRIAPGRDRAARDKGISVLLVDARPWTREALARALEAACRDLRVLCFDDASDLAQASPQEGEALVLLNLTGIPLTDHRVSAAIATTRACVPGMPVVALSDSAASEGILGAIAQGLSGYILISLELRLVIDALRFVAAGGTFVPAESLLSALDTTAASGSPAPLTLGEAATAGVVKDIAALNALTPRELAVLNQVCLGKTNKQAARALDMREATVKVHVRHIMRKLGAANRTQVALLAESLKD
jgi:DNA-binding NarL/FixJ family response regulator